MLISGRATKADAFPTGVILPGGHRDRFLWNPTVWAAIVFQMHVPSPNMSVWEKDKSSGITIGSMCVDLCV